MIGCFVYPEPSAPDWVIAVQSIATTFHPNPGVGDRHWERNRPNQMAAMVCASGQH